MKFLHTADLHLGFSAYGSSQRYDDMFESFEKVIDIAKRERVDAVLISGDLFHQIRPTNRTIALCLHSIHALRDAGIDVYVIGGNHDIPRTEGVTSPLEILSFIDGVVCAIDDYKYDDNKNTRIHMIPYCFEASDLANRLGSAMNNLSADRNILMMHTSLPDHAMVFDDIILTPPQMDLLKEFDYVALGHFHGATAGGRIRYAGSLERLTFNEKDDEKSLNVVDDDIINRIRLDNVRNMIELPALDMSKTGDPTEDILEAIRSVDISNKICRLKVHALPAIIYRAIDQRRIRKATSSAMNFDIEYEMIEENISFDVSEVHFRSIEDEWKDFSEQKGLTDVIKDNGLHYIRSAEGD